MAQLGRLPVTGDRFLWEGYWIEVVDMDGRRVDKVSGFEGGRLRRWCGVGSSRRRRSYDCPRSGCCSLEGRTARQAVKAAICRGRTAVAHWIPLTPCGNDSSGVDRSSDMRTARGSAASLTDAYRVR